jgi:orotate phosphoribosyltransferase
MKNLERLFAEKLLKIKAIKLQPANPFTWASGWKSPFYCDNRKTLSYPSLRSFVKTEITRVILEHFGTVDAIAGVATGAIPQGALVADELNLPFVYVRSTPKDHGLENLIEGELRPGMKVVVIEDLVSTGKSSLKAVEAIRRNGCDVIGMVAAYTYDFPQAAKAFKDAHVPLITLTNYEAVIDAALRTEYIDENDVVILNEWRKDPANWNPED